MTRYRGHSVPDASIVCLRCAWCLEVIKAVVGARSRSCCLVATEAPEVLRHFFRDRWLLGDVQRAQHADCSSGRRRLGLMGVAGPCASKWSPQWPRDSVRRRVVSPRWPRDVARRRKRPLRAGRGDNARLGPVCVCSARRCGEPASRAAARKRTSRAPEAIPAPSKPAGGPERWLRSKTSLASVFIDTLAPQHSKKA